MKSVFICGTGRCGTTITKKVLAQHSDVFSFDYESRFIDDPYGIIDLFLTLSQNWSTWNAEVTWREFKNLICKKKSFFWSSIYKYFRNFLTNRKAFTSLSPPRYSYLDIHEFEDIVSECLPQLEKDLEVIRYKGTWLGSPSFLFNPEISIPLCHEEIKVTRAIQSFVEKLISKILHLKGGKVWVDDSIYAHINADILLKIIPETKFIHIQRDPRDVIASYKTKVWSPSDPNQGADLYCAIMSRWQEVKDRLPADCFIEVGFEDLFSNPSDEFRKICDFINLPWQDKLLNIDLSRSNIGRWKKDLTQEEIQRITPRITPYLKKAGA